MPALDARYVESLQALPGVRSHRVPTVPPKSRDPVGDAFLVLETAGGTHKFVLRQMKSHIGREMASHLASSREDSPALLVLAPHIGAGVAETLIRAGIHYLDASGNCHIEVPSFFVHVEGKAAKKNGSAATGVRGPGLQVLFAYLAQPELLDAPIRTVAEVAGVSRQPVSAMNSRLRHEKYVLVSKTHARWHPRRREDALALWLQGYQTTLRSSLLIGAYRTRNQDPTSLKAAIVESLPKDQFRWGGTAAGFLLTGNYRGERIVVHVRDGALGLIKRVRGLPDPEGNLIVMRAFGSINWSPKRETVHPLLVYSEVLSDGSERALEAAQDLRERYLVPLWNGGERSGR